MIIVGIECSHEGNHRLDEYCPYDANLMGIKIHGEGDETLDWITKSLKPFIDRKFRTYPSREATAIAGSSMGGLMSLYAVTKYNNVFSKAACVSSSIFMVMQPLMDDIYHSRILQVPHQLQPEGGKTPEQKRSSHPPLLPARRRTLRGRLGEGSPGFHGFFVEVNLPKQSQKNEASVTRCLVLLFLDLIKCSYS